VSNGRLERLSKLVCKNLIACPELDSGSRLWEGLWERIIMEEWSNGVLGKSVNLLIANSKNKQKQTTFNL